MHDNDVSHLIGIMEAMPMKETILSILFIYAWKRAYGPKFTGGDIALGIAYGFTIPDALRGGTLANSYALGALGVLGVGFIPTEIWDRLGAIPGAVVDKIKESADLPKPDWKLDQSDKEIIKPDWWDNPFPIFPPWDNPLKPRISP